MKWELTRSSYVVGRFGDIRLSSPDVSKRHAELRLGSDGVWLNDLGSRNGVLHNGQHIAPGQPVRLAEGDQLQFGSMQLVFRCNASQQPRRSGTGSARDDQDRTTQWPGAQFRSGPGPTPSGNGSPPPPPPPQNPPGYAPHTHSDDSSGSFVTNLRDFRHRRAANNRQGGPDSDLPPPPSRHAPPPPVEDDARSMTTRHLAAATQFDPWFADQVVRQVVNEPFRALAPVFGADLGVVTRWALAARRRRLTRDSVLFALLVFLVGLIGTAVRTHWDEIDEIKAGQPAFDWQSYAFGAGFVLGLAWLVLAVDIWVTDYLVLRRKLTPSRYEPAHAPGASSRRARARLAAVAERPAGNLIVCSHFSPFAGSGDQVDEWEMPIDIRKGAPHAEGGRRRPQPFTTGELYDVLIAAARRIGLNNLRVEERLFVDGQDVARDRRLLPDPLQPPLTRIPTPLIRSMPDGLGATRRSYVSIEVPAWSGQLVVTMFLRAVQVQGTLYLEWSAHALLPMFPAYYAVDYLPYRTSVGAALRALAEALPRALPALLRSPRALARRAATDRAAAARRHRQRRTIRGGYRFDYGAQHSIREFACGWDEGRYFLGRDLSRAVYTTQQHLMNTIGDFLESKGIDSENFLRFQQNLVQNFTTNNDFSVRAKNINAGVFAHGKNARASGGGGPAPARPAQRG